MVMKREKLGLEVGHLMLSSCVTANKASRWKCYSCEESQPQTFHNDNEESTLTVFISFVGDEGFVEYPTCDILLVLADACMRFQYMSGEVELPDAVNQETEENNAIINNTLVGMLEALSADAGYTL